MPNEQPRINSARLYCRKDLFRPLLAAVSLVVASLQTGRPSKSSYPSHKAFPNNGSILPRNASRKTTPWMHPFRAQARYKDICVDYGKHG